ncbi:hypothetical protein CF635_003511 [Enterobacter hormaechei]|nr:hypothetical protein [Enterobacter hormaechei]
MKQITQLEQYIQQRIKKSKSLTVIRILESRLNKINNTIDGDDRTVKALEAAKIITLHLSKYYGETNE